MAELESRDGSERYAERLSVLVGVLRDQDRDGRDPQAVAKTVEHAVLSSRPSSRYPIGVPAHVDAAAGPYSGSDRRPAGPASGRELSDREPVSARGQRGTCERRNPSGRRSTDGEDGARGDDP